MKSRGNGATVFVALSGGVDSSVAAYLLTQQGYRVVGVFMKPWQPEGFVCAWENERADALRVSASLGIAFETWDFSREYERYVSRPMVEAYRDGFTPNPDVECNRHIKFGLFYRRAMKRGANFIATGHYARLGRSARSCVLRTAVDATKDQTYFLWGLQQRVLSRVLFPVGGLKKSEVRVLAVRAHLTTATKKDSQGVCFVGQLDMKSFLSSVIEPKRGDILHVDGRILGEHDGAGYYTIGQRHGLDIRIGGGPYFVIGKNMKSNTITVGPSSELRRRDVRIRSLHWIGPRPTGKQRIQARIRYRGALVPATLDGQRVVFDRPVRAIASGQSIVFYRRSRVLGGAIMR